MRPSVVIAGRDPRRPSGLGKARSLQSTGTDADGGNGNFALGSLVQTDRAPLHANQGPQSLEAGAGLFPNRGQLKLTPMWLARAFASWTASARARADASPCSAVRSVARRGSDTRPHRTP